MIRLLAVVLLGCAALLTLTPTPARSAGGDLLWQDQFDLTGGEDIARAVAVGNDRVFVVGSAQNAAGNRDFVVRAYDAKSGSLIWKDVVDVAGGEDAATAVVVADNRVIVAGTGTSAAGSSLLLLRAYAANTGELAWEDRSAFVTVNGLDADGSHVIVAGTIADSAGNTTLAVRAYIARTGVLDWQDNPSPPAGFVQFFGSARKAVAIQGRRVFVAVRYEHH